jgi:hypothetical protein
VFLQLRGNDLMVNRYRRRMSWLRGVVERPQNIQSPAFRLNPCPNIRDESFESIEISRRLSQWQHLQPGF